MVLVDTSVWIRFLANLEPFAEQLDSLLDQDAVAGHNLIYGELLIGDRSGRQELLADYSRMHRLHPIPDTDVVSFVRARRLYGRGIGWIDAHLLASALVADIPLWTADQRLAELASQLGVGYHAS